MIESGLYKVTDFRYEILSNFQLLLSFLGNCFSLISIISIIQEYNDNIVQEITFKVINIIIGFVSLIVCIVAQGIVVKFNRRKTEFLQVNNA